jgi:hypothetical protein
MNKLIKQLITNLKRNVAASKESQRKMAFAVKVSAAYEWPVEWESEGYCYTLTRKKIHD